MKQLSLLGAARKRRVALDDTSWVEHVPRWLTDDKTLLTTLEHIPEWEQRTRWMYDKHVIEPRLTAEYRVLAEAPIERLVEIGARLSAEYGIPYDRAWLNLYRDNQDSTSWHSDKPCVKEMCVVPVLSLGETRRFLIRRREGGPSLTFACESGDLVVMGGRCQRDWVHCVPKERGTAGMRISVNFSSTTQDADS